VSIEAVREARAAPLATPVQTQRASSGPAGLDGPSPFARILAGLGREVEDGESLMRSALHANRGKANMDPADLIALQAGVYRYGEAVDLASRLIDRVTSGVKTIVQAQ